LLFGTLYKLTAATEQKIMNTPTILRKILATKEQEIAERSKTLP